MTTHHIYIHFPYCLYKCHYCDFNSYAYERASIPEAGYTQALLRELELRQREFEISGVGAFATGTPVDSVFFGGGTPSLMAPADVEKILRILDQHFPLRPETEITLECNPGTVTQKRLSEFMHAGINRASIGIQSFQDRYLKTFGRIHSGQEAVQAVQAALAAGLPRVSADLIFGFPGQTLPEWQADVEMALSLGLKHLSAYALTAEEGTLYTRDLQRGRLQETESETFEALQLWTYDRFSEAGLPAYEISNFAAAGEESRHNLGYWRYQPCLGLGAGAFSTFFNPGNNPESYAVRHMNQKAPEHYLRKVQEGVGVWTREDIDKLTAMKEYVMMGLRLSCGLDVADFKKRFGRDLWQAGSKTWAQQLAQERILLHKDHILPTRQGLLFNNTLLQELFAEFDEVVGSHL